MASILPTFEYDIFISYRHNDNRSGWVTEFVKALQEELAATIKEPISVYFDSNPHDGLLETHNVDKSLEGKLKCLIFIPILSQTYCDPKSFAWQHEFCAFNKLAKEDSLGWDIKLSNGNVASRILPIKIHDLDADDKTIIENEIGGVLRAIEFIFKSSGVNRPVTSSDKREENSNKTFYRDQINKVANAIKEIISALKNPVPQKLSTINYQPPTSPTNSKTKFIFAGAIVLALIIVGYFLYPKFSSSTKQETAIDKSIAVLPFKNMSNDPEQEYFSDGIAEELINALAKKKSLKVAGRTSSFSFKGRDQDLRKIGESLGVNTILEGSVRKSGNTVRITAQLINVRDGFHLWTETFDREISDIFKVQDEITAAIIEELKVHLTPDEITVTTPVNVEAYPFYLKARQKLAQRGINNLIEARDLFYQALQLDSTYSPSYSGLSKTLSLLNIYSQSDQRFSKSHKESYKYASKALELDPANAEAHLTFGIAKSQYDWQWLEAEKAYAKAVEMNPNDAELNNFLGDFYRVLADYKKAEKFELRALELDPLHAINHWDLGIIYFNMNELGKAKDYFRSALRIDPALVQLMHPAMAYAYISNPFIIELDSAVRRLDNANIPTSIIIQLQTSIAIGKGNQMEFQKNLAKIEKLGAEEIVSYSYLFDYNFINGNEEKAAYWADKAVQAKDALLVYQSFKNLPEQYQSERIRKALASPALDALYKIRRKNLGLN